MQRAEQHFPNAHNCCFNIYSSRGDWISTNILLSVLNCSIFKHKHPHVWAAKETECAATELLHRQSWGLKALLRGSEDGGHLLRKGLFSFQSGHGWVLHCSRSGGLSWISQLRSLNRSPFGRWHTTNLVLMPPPHGLVHWGEKKTYVCYGDVVEKMEMDSL